MDWYSRFVLAWDIPPPPGPFAWRLWTKPRKSPNRQFSILIRAASLPAWSLLTAWNNTASASAGMARGRLFDNIFVARLWRSVKYAEVYLHQYETVSEARNCLERYFLFSNMERLHESLGYQTPYQVYVKKRLTSNFVQASTIHQIQPYFFVLTMGEPHGQ